MTLFEDGNEIGTVSDWKLVEVLPEKRFVLGKEIVMPKPKNRCEFVSPKPIRRSQTHWIIAVDGTKMMLADVKVVGGTRVSAAIYQ